MTAKQRFVAALSKLAAVFRVETSDLMVEAYWEALAAWAPEALEGGARALVRTGRYFPRPAEWAQAAEDFMRERVREERDRRLRLPQSTEEALGREEVRRLLGELGGRLGWPPEPEDPAP